MHVPETWDEEFSAPVDDARIARDLCVRGGPGVDDPGAAENYGVISSRATGNDINDPDVRDCYGLLPGFVATPGSEKPNRSERAR
jgi:hypothetical protein